jgi:hypothetical protein
VDPTDVDTFLTTVYCLVDDLYRQHVAPMREHRPGRPGQLSDSEVLTLMLLAQWQAAGSERQFIGWAARHWRAYFPRLLSQSAFNRRARNLYGVLARYGEWLRQGAERALDDDDEAVATATYEVVDGVAVPLMRRGRGQRHRCFGVEADIGRGGSDRDWYYGVKVLAGVDNLGFLTGWVVGPASTGERWLAEALFVWRRWPSAALPTPEALAGVLGPSHHAAGQRVGARGPIRGRCSAGQPAAGATLADLGLQGAAWRAHWRSDLGATVLLKSDYGQGPTQPDARRWFNRHRQSVERLFSTLQRAFRLGCPRARTFWGLLTRLAAMASAYNLAVALNYAWHRPSHAILSPFA